MLYKGLWYINFSTHSSFHKRSLNKVRQYSTQFIKSSKIKEKFTEIDGQRNLLHYIVYVSKFLLRWSHFSPKCSGEFDKIQWPHKIHHVYLIISLLKIISPDPILIRLNARGPNCSLKCNNVAGKLTVEWRRVVVGTW